MMKSNNKRILLIANTSWYLFNFKGSLIKKLILDGYVVYYFCLDNIFRNELEHMGCKLICKEVYDSKIKSISNFWFAKTTLSIENIYTFTLTGTILGSVFKFLKMKDAKIYNTITGLGNFYLVPIFGKYILKKIYQIFLRNSNCVFVQNSSDKEFIETLCNPGTAIRYVAGSGVDTLKFRQLAMPCKAQIKLLIATRFIDNKGLKELFTVMLRLKPLYGSALELHVSGTRNFSGAGRKLRSLIHDSELAGAVKFIGHSESMPTLLGEYDAAILPSYREGLSKFLLEAAAVGRPLLVSDVPGCRELVQHGVNGFLFKPRDTKDLQGCIVNFLALEPQTRLSMGEASRRLIENGYDEQLVNRQYIEVLK